MYLIPKVKEMEICPPFIINGCTFEFSGNIDQRVINASEKVPNGSTKVIVSVSGNTGKDIYDMSLSEKEIVINAKTQAGAFYAIQTIRQIIANGECTASKISDFPDFKNRGFYFDTTRGRVPTVKTAKELVDTLAYHKMNMLQFYVEHTFEFKEYDGIYQKACAFTKDEIREIDEYCKENFIEFVPSLSCFGHLYELLQSEKYKHLSELENYEPTSITWSERMAHHTIDASNPESIEVIKSLIDQYSPLFTSDKFNICCDETFDLGTGKNKGKDKGRLYVDFLNKIIAHVKSKGKTPMMWGDVIKSHPDLFDEIDKDTIFLSWDYSASPNTTVIELFKNAQRKQYVCPGVSGWSRFIECINTSIPNIDKMAKSGYENGAEGFLNTCWGDFGHTVPLRACMYSTLFGAERAWNANSDTDDFDEAMDALYYGYDGASHIVKTLSEVHTHANWYFLCCIYAKSIGKFLRQNDDSCDPNELEQAFERCEEVIPYLMATKWKNDEARKDFLAIANGIECLLAVKMSVYDGEKLGVNMSDVENFLAEYKERYMQESKLGELKEIIHVLYYVAQKHLM